MSFQKKYEKILEDVSGEISLVVENLTNDMHIQEPLNSKLFELLHAPSKHIRAAISFLYLKAIGIKINEEQISLQVAIELAHNASLIHDDIIDESSSRRNIPTLNKQFGNKLAVISGDYLLSLALKRICKINNPNLTHMFAQTLDDMCQGEIFQFFNKYKFPTLEQYIQKSEQKTAKLFETAICGALLIGKSDIDATKFAKNFGIIFQLRDDLINIKTSKTDLQDGIYTAPIIFSNNTKDLKFGIEKTVTLLNNYVEETIKLLENIENNKYKEKIIELLELLKDE